MSRNPATAALAHIPALRLHAQLLARQPFSTPAGVVAHMLALQAQDPVWARWAVGARLPEGAREAHILSALAQGSILRTHLFRRTWQLVAPADIRWLLALMGPELIARDRARCEELGLTKARIRKGLDAIPRALERGAHKTRAELGALLGRMGLPSEGPPLAHLLQRAELLGLVCSGAPRGKRETYALLDERVPAPRGPCLGREEALAELARRYFRSRGPATLRDFAWWASLGVRDASLGLEAARSELHSLSVEGQAYFLADPGGGGGSGVHLLPAFDEVLIAYRERGAILDPAQARRINRGGGMIAPCLVAGGRVAGTWSRSLSGSGVSVEVELFRTAKPPNRRALLAAARRYAGFLGLEVRLVGAR